MTRKLLFALTLMLCFIGVNAAEHNVKVDLNRIKVDVVSNPDNYRSLLNRFVVGDTTLTLDEMATVYYGYAYTLDYNPLDKYEALEKCYNDGEYAETWQLCSEALKYNPVSLDLTIKALVAANNCDIKTAHAMIPALESRFNLISTIILSSGKGTADDSPFIVICTQDIIRIIRNVLCAESILGQTNIRNIDAYILKFPLSDRQHIIYFDNNIQKDFEKQYGE